MIQSRLQSLQEMEVISSQGVEFCGKWLRLGMFEIFSEGH